MAWLSEKGQKSKGYLQLNQKLTRLMGLGIKIKWPILKTKVLIYQCEANSDAEVVWLWLSHLSSRLNGS